MSEDFSNAVGKAAVDHAATKFSCKDINFKEPRTWGWLLGIVASILLVIAGFGNLSCLAAAFFAIVFGGALCCLEFFCCFKCCAATKACATKGDKIVSNPFIKGSCYIVVSVVGIVLSALSCLVTDTSTTPPTTRSSAAPWNYVLYGIAAAAGVCNIIFGFMQRARDGGAAGATGTSGTSTTYSDGAPSEPDFSQA